MSNDKISIYSWWRLRDNKQYIFLDWYLYNVKYKRKILNWTVSNKEVQKSIKENKFSFKEELREQFLKEFKKEIDIIRKHFIEHWNNIFLEFYDYKTFFQIKRDILKFLIYESKYFYWKYFLDHNKIMNFIRWKEKYFTFYWTDQDNYDLERTFTNKENSLFVKYYTVEEWKIFLWKQIESFKNKNKEIEKEVFKIRMSNSWVKRFWKQDTNRKNRKKLKNELRIEWKKWNLENISNYKIPRDQWKYN